MKRALEALMRIQKPGTGWSHHRREGHPDADPTPWAFMALKSAKASEVAVAGLEAAFKKASKRYEKEARPTTGMAVATDVIGCVWSGFSWRDPRLKAGVERLVTLIPRPADRQLDALASTSAPSPRGRSGGARGSSGTRC